MHIHRSPLKCQVRGRLCVAVVNRVASHMTFTWICGKDADWLVLNVQDGRTNQDAALDKYRKSHAAEHVVFTGVQLRAIWLRTRKMAADFKQKHL